MDRPTNVVRMLEWYEKTGEEFVGEALLPCIGLDHLKQLFGEQERDPLFYDLYQISERDAPFLRSKVHADVDFDFDRYAYYIACVAARSENSSHLQ